MRKQLLTFSLLLSTSLCFAEAPLTPKNKLFEMLRLFYLPFEIDVVQGETPDEIIPTFEKSKSGEPNVISLEAMQKLDKQWETIRSTWKAKSLFRDVKVELNGTVKISSHFFSHRIASSRGALDTLSIEERIRMNDLVKGKSKDVQAAVLQKRFLRSFIEPNSIEKPHFFIVAPNWCSSSENYRTILEWYTRKLALGSFILHSIIIEDPKESIFDSKAMTDLFPFPKHYSHESVPRFLMTEMKEGELLVHEEGEALKLFYDTYLEPHQGFMKAESPLPILSKISSR